MPADRGAPQAQAAAAAATRADAIGKQVAGLERHEGFVSFYVDADTNKLYLELERFDRAFLYAAAMSEGGLDIPVWWDGWPWSELEAAVIQFERHPSQVLLVRRRPGRAAPDIGDDGNAGGVDRAFVSPVLASMPVVAEEGGRVLVDATEFFLRDAVDLIGRVANAGDGRLRLDRDRSRIHSAGSRALPDNTEIEASLTFGVEGFTDAGSDPAPPGSPLTVRIRHSLLALPPAGFAPRAFDMRLGFLNPIEDVDFARSYEESYLRRWIHRWRLEKSDPGAARSEVKRPIVFYVDASVPDRYRTAVAQGVMYWDAAFRDAGFEDVFRVEDLPAGADPMDLQYPAVIRWSPSSSMESSSASFFSDPRTGEILKAVVYVDAYRDQVNLNRFLAIAPALGEPAVNAEEYVELRRRWVVAHEVGHVLAGLAHNDISASNIGFPVPQLYRNDNGTVRIDLSTAFHHEATPYDKRVVRYAYADLPGVDASGELAEIVEEGLRSGLLAITDYGVTANPRATGRLVDADRLAELERSISVRRALLSHFDESALRPGEPMQLLAARLVPVYFHHRPAIAAAVRTVGGMEYTYAVRGDGQTPTSIIDPATQRRALALLLSTLDPAELRIPELVASLIPPLPPGTQVGPPGMLTAGPRGIRYFDGESGSIVIPSSPGGVFDPLGWARSVAKLVIDPLLESARLARVVSFHARAPDNISLDEVILQVIQSTWGIGTPSDAMDAALGRVVQRAVLDRLLELRQSPEITPEVRGAVRMHLERLGRTLQDRRPDDAAERAHVAAALADIAGIEAD